MAKQRKNHRSSLRAFAAQCGVSQSLLSQVLNGKKNLSTLTAMKVINQLELSQDEKNQFLENIEMKLSTKQLVAAIYFKGVSMFKGKLVRFRAHKKSDVADYVKLFHNEVSLVAILAFSSIKKVFPNFLPQSLQ